jgi:hypothetical protein
MLVLLRHAEKTPHHGDPVHLSARGRARARLLASDYLPHPAGLFPVPGRLVAMAPHRRHPDRHSHRCAETLQPTADALGLPLHARRYARGEGRRAVASAARHARRSSDGGSVVVCWEHAELPAMARALGFRDVRSWGLRPCDPDRDAAGHDCFDATWVVDLEKQTLRVYRQFDIDRDGRATWPWPRTVPTAVVHAGHRRRRCRRWFCGLF